MRFTLRFLLPFLCCISLCCGAQNAPQNCAPVPGSCNACDSIRQWAHRQAIAATFFAVQDSASPYYDSLFIPSTLIRRFEQDLIVFYNSCPDSLTTFHPQVSVLAHSDTASFYQVMFIINSKTYRKWIKDSASTHDPAIDALIAAAQLRRTGPDKITEGNCILIYSASRLLNLGFINRQLKKMSKKNIYVQSFFQQHPYRLTNWSEPGMVMRDEKGNTVITVTLPVGAGMPPEEPFPMAEWVCKVEGCRLQLVSFRNLDER